MHTLCHYAKMSLTWMASFVLSSGSSTFGGPKVVPPNPFGFDTDTMTAPETLPDATPLSKDVPCFEELTSSRDPWKDPLFRSLKRKFENLLMDSTLETAGKEDERIFEDLFAQKPIPTISQMDSPIIDTPDTETSSCATHSNDVVSRSAAYRNEQDESGLNSAAKTPSDPAERRQAYLRFFALLRSQQKASIPIICWEREYTMKHPVLRLCADENVNTDTLEVTHILPFSTGTFTDDNCFKSKNETWFFLLRLSPHLRERIPTNLHINCLENILLMSYSLHSAFDRFHWALHQTETANEYDIKIHARCDLFVREQFDRIGWKVKFTTSDLKRLPVPYPDLLALHAAIAQVVHLKGFGEETEQPFEDSDDDCCSGLATDGSTDVERLLAATVLPALEAKTSYRLSSTANTCRIPSSKYPKHPVPSRVKPPGLENQPPGTGD